jgi:hypothetical protein
MTPRGCPCRTFLTRSMDCCRATKCPPLLPPQPATRNRCPIPGTQFAQKWLKALPPAAAITPKDAHLVGSPGTSRRREQNLHLGSGGGSFSHRRCRGSGLIGIPGVSMTSQTRLTQFEEAASARSGDAFTGFKMFCTLKQRPESGLDCLVCAMFA